MNSPEIAPFQPLADLIREDAIVESTDDLTCWFSNAAQSTKLWGEGVVGLTVQGVLQWQQALTRSTTISADSSSVRLSESSDLPRLKLANSFSAATVSAYNILRMKTTVVPAPLANKELGKSGEDGFNGAPSWCYWGKRIQDPFRKMSC